MIYPIQRIILRSILKSVEEAILERNTLVPEIPGDKRLVLAPHVDDDFIGCGGMILQTVKNRKRVEIAYLTDSGKRGTGGDAAARSTERRKEAVNVAESTGIPPEHLHFLQGVDGELFNSSIEEELSRLIRKMKPDAIFAPIFLDTHKDHIACLEKLLYAIRKEPATFKDIKIYFYESQSPITPKYSNIVLDITDFWKEKRRALQGYPSQGNDFAFVEVMNRVNGETFRKPYCEVFLKVSPEDLAEFQFSDSEELLRIRERLEPLRGPGSLLKAYKSSLRNKEGLEGF